MSCCGCAIHDGTANTANTSDVTFGLNVRLDLSGKATTKSLSSLSTELVLKILGEGTGIVTVWVIRGCEGVGDFPGVRGGSGESERILCK